MSQGEDILRAVLELANHHDADAIQAYLSEDMRFRNPITGEIAIFRHRMGNKIKNLKSVSDQRMFPCSNR